MYIRLLRHATLVVTIGSQTLLVDPMLSLAGAMDPVANAASQQRIPLVELPIGEAELAELLARADGVLVTHTHRDHWDARAVELIPKDKPILCQPADAASIGGAGFTNVRPLEDVGEWLGLMVARTGGHHGTGEIGQRMGAVSGFVLSAPGEPSLYIAGDTIWCDEVAAALGEHRPDVAVLNAGAAQFLTGDPITMTTADVAQVCAATPGARVVAVHMGAINHCLLTREALRDQLADAGHAGRVAIPEDGEALELSQ